MRFSQGEWPLAWLDLVMSVSSLCIGLYVLVSHKIVFASFCFAIVAMATAVTTVVLQGEAQVLWVYPAVIVCYYLIPFQYALVVSSVGYLVIFAVLYADIEPVRFFSIVGTLTISNAFAFIFAKNMQKTQDALLQQARLDALTNIGNRRALDEKLTDIVLMQQREPSTVSLILFDLDYFKVVNDNHGHRVGDQVLMDVVKTVQRRLRVSDSLYRYGGEEFVVVPVRSGSEAAAGLAEELRLLIEQHTFESKISITISLGVAQYRQGDTYSDWLERADQALYQAKTQGRNRVVCVD